MLIIKAKIIMIEHLLVAVGVNNIHHVLAISPFTVLSVLTIDIVSSFFALINDQVQGSYAACRIYNLQCS